MPLSLDGKANADDDSKSEDLPCMEVRVATSDRPHAVLLLCCKTNESLSSGKGFFMFRVWNAAEVLLNYQMT